jgi:hypothetical protein
MICLFYLCCIAVVLSTLLYSVVKGRYGVVVLGSFLSVNEFAVIRKIGFRV